MFGVAKLGRSRTSMCSAADTHPVCHRPAFSGSLYEKRHRFGGVLLFGLRRWIAGPHK